VQARARRDPGFRYLRRVHPAQPEVREGRRHRDSSPVAPVKGSVVEDLATLKNTWRAVAAVPISESFDMVVIGAGPGGEKAAAQAAFFGKRVALAERQAAPGGALVSSAGVPTKTLRETALYLTGYRRREVYGLSIQLDPDATLDRLMDRTAQVQAAMTDQV